MHKLIVVAVLLSQAGASQPTPASIVARYVEAIGGENALRAVKTRVIDGQFDNGRGLNTRYRQLELAPNQKVTLIGPQPIESQAGSGRGFDGAAGWDKNYIGTGLRTLQGRELADLARDADMLRPLHLLDECASVAVESQQDEDIVRCVNGAGTRISLYFDRTSGLLERFDFGVPGVMIHYEDYRVVDGVRLPFKTRIDVPGATVLFNASSISQNAPVEPAIFQRPRS